MKEIQEHKIKIYEFPDTEDDEDNKLIRKIKVMDHTVLLVKLDMRTSDWESRRKPEVSLSFGQDPTPAAASVPFPHAWQPNCITLHQLYRQAHWRTFTSDRCPCNTVTAASSESRPRSDIMLMSAISGSAASKTVRVSQCSPLTREFLPLTTSKPCWQSCPLREQGVQNGQSYCSWLVMLHHLVV